VQVVGRRVPRVVRVVCALTGILTARISLIEPVMADEPTVVAVFNTSEDTTDMLRVILEQAGFVVVSAFTRALRDGKIDLEALMRQHRPKVVVYDVALPYDANWRLFEHIRASPACRGVRFVITTTHAVHVRSVAGVNEEVLEIVGKPYDLAQLVAAVRKAAAE
jgi:DNA-binding response OmpR family regulator